MLQKLLFACPRMVSQAVRHHLDLVRRMWEEYA